MPSTDAILRHFRRISQIPRCSGNEAGIRNWLIEWAAGHGFTHATDAVGNLVIRVPASPSAPNAPTVVLQGHLDMVCEKTPDSPHDFERDPLTLEILVAGATELRIKAGDAKTASAPPTTTWLTADRTTLGADNGIAIAMAMAVAEDASVKRGPLELLFTVDEETGLTGATELDLPLDGRLLINIDSEDEGVITVGCAGGIESELKIPVTREAFDGDSRADVAVFGLSGGHSGVDIHEMRGNAIRVLARVLQRAAASVELRLVDLKGGSAHNAIPRDAQATIVYHGTDRATLEGIIEAAAAVYAAEFKNTDPNLGIALRDASATGIPLTAIDTMRALDFLMAVPHGVAAMSTDIEGLVETSNNEATTRLEDHDLVVTTSQRSSVVSRLEAHTDRISGIARLAGGTARVHGGYPPWQPNMDSKLLAIAHGLYKDRFDRDPVVEVIHAGLECGIIGAKYDGMDMISIGPTIENPHSPDERLSLDTLEPVWLQLCDLLTALAEG